MKKVKYQQAISFPTNRADELDYNQRYGAESG